MVRKIVRRLAGGVGGQERALSNARAAATDLARLRVEREEVEIYLALRADRVALRAWGADSLAR